MEDEHEAQSAVDPLVEDPSMDRGIRARFARGGPIYIPNLISPITTASEFETAVTRELRSLESELQDAGDFEIELSVEELKVLTEEELVEKALKEDFDENGSEGITSGIFNGENCLSIVGMEEMDGINASLRAADASGSSVEAHGARKSKEKKAKSKSGKKRGRVFDRDSRAAELEGSYFSKVEHLAGILQRQNEDMAAARLHSFSGDCQLAKDGVAAATKRTEKMQALRFITTPLKAKPRLTTESLPVTYPEVVISVEVYTCRANVKKTQELLVLGRQRLTALRDQIYCLTDQLMLAAGQHDKSGYFLIEDLICNDLRDPSSTDYSEPVLDWLRNNRDEAEEKWEYIMSGELKQKQRELLGSRIVSSLPNLKATDMDETRFCDLRFRLGSGYLYCHQGDCKHILVFRDMRLIHPEDDQNMAAYPILTFQMKLRHRKCSVCEIFIATKMTVDDKWTPRNPCYFCDNCYFLLHYNKEGSLLYDAFTVYDYYHE